MDINKLVKESAKKSGHKTKKMYHVEKFLPVECPHCRKAFKQQNEDWTLLLGDIIDGHKTVRETDGYDIIICDHCENYTARFKLESYQLSDKKAAKKLVKEEGFVNLQEVLATGTHCQDMHAVYAKMPGMKVLGIKCDGEDSDKA